MTLSEKKPKKEEKTNQNEKENDGVLKTNFVRLEFFEKKTIRKKQNNVVLPGFCYREKDRKNGLLEGKKQLLSSSFRSLFSQLAVVVVLAQCAPPERLT